MNKEAIIVLQEYLADHDDNSGRYSWRKGYFEQHSYSQWAIQELIRRVRIKKKTPPIIVIEDFIREMDGYSCRHSSSSFMFSIAKDTAEDIYDIFLAISIKEGVIVIHEATT